jgi:propionyl-CoA synthetase
MIAEAAFAMLACARIGAIHCVVFGGFASGSWPRASKTLSPRVIVSADAGSRGGKAIAYKPLLDEAIRCRPTSPSAVLLADRQLAAMDLVAGRDHLWADLRERTCDAQVPAPGHGQSTDISYTIYTSGHHRQAQGRAARHRRLRRGAGRLDEAHL